MGHGQLRCKVWYFKQYYYGKIKSVVRVSLVALILAIYAADKI